MDSYDVNFVHKQMYEVYNHFGNGEKQIGHVETDKLYYIAKDYNIPSTLLDAILNKNIETIFLRVKRTYMFSGKIYIERHYKIEDIIPRIFADGSVSYDIFVEDFDEKDALYMSRDYLYTSENECDMHIEKISDKCLIDIGDKIKTQTGMQRYINKEIDKTNEQFKQYIKEHIEKLEAN